MRIASGLLVMAAVLVGCDGEEGTLVGPRGGVVTSPDGRVTLEIPEGALDEEIAVSIDEVDEGPEDAVGRVYAVEPALTMLQRPATLTYDFGAPALEGAEHLDLNAADMADLALVTEKEHGWARLADREVDAEAKVVTGSIMFFGTYAVVFED